MGMLIIKLQMHPEATVSNASKKKKNLKIAKQ